MSNNYLSKLTNEEFEVQVDSILKLVNRCHRVYSIAPIEWSFSRSDSTVSCTIPYLTAPQLLAFQVLFSLVCHFACCGDSHNLVIYNY